YRRPDGAIGMKESDSRDSPITQRTDHQTPNNIPARTIATATLSTAPARRPPNLAATSACVKHVAIANAASAGKIHQYPGPVSSFHQRLKNMPAAINPIPSKAAAELRKAMRTGRAAG